MPARKLQGLKTRHDTAEEKAARISEEQAMTPDRELPKNPPAQLKGHDVAGKAWRRIMRAYDSAEAVIVTAFDFDNLVDLCIGMEQLEEMDQLRKEAKANAERASRILDDVSNPTDRNGNPIDKDYGLIVDCLKAYKAAEDSLKQYDARCDAKRKFLLTLRQSLYLTPRSRAATAPTKKEKEEPVDPFEDLLLHPAKYVRDTADEKA